MRVPLSRGAALTLFGVFATLAARCNSDKLEPIPVLVSTDVATSTEQAAAVDPSYDPTLMMYAKFPRFDRNFEMTAPALESIRQHNDVSQVPVLVDLLTRKN